MIFHSFCLIWLLHMLSILILDSKFFFFFKKKDVILFYSCQCFACIHTCICITCVPGAHGSQKRALKPLDPRFMDSFEQEQNLGPLQEQPMFFEPMSHLSTNGYQFFNPQNETKFISGITKFYHYDHIFTQKYQ